MNKPNHTTPAMRPCTLVYLLLMGLTLVTWYIGKQGLGGLHLSLLVLGFALLKGQLVGDFFMQLKGVRSLWRWVILLWLVIPGALISWAFLLSAKG